MARYRRRYRYNYRRHRRKSGFRTAGKAVRFTGRAAGKFGYGAFKFGAKAASYLVVTGARTGAGIVRALIGR